MKQYNLANSLDRILAALVDAIIIIVLQAVVDSFLGEQLRQTYTDLNPSIRITFGKPISTVAAVVGLLYYLVFTALWGATVGKKMLGIQVVSKDTGEKPSFDRVFLREVVGKAISGVFIGLGFIWIVFDKKHQGWHDKLASTLVVRV